MADATNLPNHEVYCDESRPELFVGAGAKGGKSIIGSLWMPGDFRGTLKRDIALLREKHSVWGEFKWNKVSPSKLDFYRELVDYFFDHEELQFRAIAVDAAKLNLTRFHQNDAELGFYKFYYQLLTHWIVPQHAYSIYCDDKVNRDRKRLPVLLDVLRNANRGSSIACLQAVPSHQSAAVQLCDVLMGATQWCANGGQGTSVAKRTVIADIEKRLGRNIAPTWQSERKFNVFEIRLQEQTA